MIIAWTSYDIAQRFPPAGTTNRRMTTSKVAEAEPIVKGEPELVDWRKRLSNQSNYPTDQSLFVMWDFISNLPTEGLKPTQEWSQASFGEDIYGLSLVVGLNFKLQTLKMAVNFLIYISCNGTLGGMSHLRYGRIQNIEEYERLALSGKLTTWQQQQTF